MVQWPSSLDTIVRASGGGCGEAHLDLALIIGLQSASLGVLRLEDFVLVKNLGARRTRLCAAAFAYYRLDVQTDFYTAVDETSEATPLHHSAIKCRNCFLWGTEMETLIL